MSTLRDGPFRGADAIARGLLTRSYLRGPSFRRLYRDVYVCRDEPLDHLTWCRASALVLPAGAAISHRSAAYLLGANVLPIDAPVEVSVPHGCRAPGHAGLSVRHATLAASDVRRGAGLAVTTAVRTAFDIGRGDDLTEAVVGLDALLGRRVVEPARIAEYAQRHPGWPGVRRLHRALDLAEPAAESPMESRLRMVIINGGLPRPVVQQRILLGPGHTARADLAYPEQRVALEYDGDHHRDRPTFQRDVRRLNLLRLGGWTVLRFTADDVLRHPDRVVAEVRAVM